MGSIEQVLVKKLRAGHNKVCPARNHYIQSMLDTEC